MDIKINYMEKGAGQPLVLLHGNGGDLSSFAKQIDCFSRHFRVIALDTRGHGKTPRGTEEFTLCRFADDLMELLTEMNIPKTNILGFSDGANIAMLFALKYPSRVNKLVLSGGNIFPRGLKSFFLVPTWGLYAAAAALAPVIKGAKAKKELLGLMTKEPHITPYMLRFITAPALVTAGTHDLIKDSHSRLIADALGEGRFVAIPGGHSVMQTNSGEYNRVVMSFLTE